MNRSKRLVGLLAARRPEPAMTVARSVADVLTEHVLFEVESIDRMYLNVWQPRLVYGGGAHGFFVAHRGYHYTSTALMDPMTKAFVADVHGFVAAHSLELVSFAKSQRKDDLAQESLARFSDQGVPLSRWLATDGIIAADVPAKLATRVRMLSTGHGRKNDDADAVSVGIAALTASGSRSAAVEEAIVALRALVEHRDDIVRTRTQTVNRLHVLLAQLLPGGAPRQLGADTAAQLLRTVRPRATGPRTLRRLAVDLVAEVRHLDRLPIPKAQGCAWLDLLAALEAACTAVTGRFGPVGVLGPCPLCPPCPLRRGRHPGRAHH